MKQSSTNLLPNNLKAFAQSTGSSAKVRKAAPPLPPPSSPGVLPAGHTVCPHRPPLLAPSRTQQWRSPAWPCRWVAVETRAVLPVGCSWDKSCRHPTKNTYQQFVRLFKRDLSPITENPARFKALPTFSLLPSISSNFLPGQMLQLQTRLAMAERKPQAHSPATPRDFPNPGKRQSYPPLGLTTPA